MKDIFLVYRNNDLFAKYISKLTEMIKSLGYNVETKSFPRGTEKKEIERWILENKEILKGKVYFSDDTCALYSFYSNKEISDLRKGLKMGDLDSLFQEATARAVIGEDEAFVIRGGEIRLWKTVREQMRQTEKAFNRKSVDSEVTEKKKQSSGRAIPILIKQIIEKNGLPNQVSIVASKYLLSHEPFNRYYGFIPREKEDLSLEDLQDAIDRAVSKITEWLIRGGIPKERISTRNDDSSDKEGNWVIFDRHEFTTNRKNRPRKAFPLQLPLPNFFQDALEHLCVPRNHMEENLVKVLERFLKEEEE
jgi:hypothetical protein